MKTRYLLVLKDNEGIVTIGHLPRVGEVVRVQKEYGDAHPVVYIVDRVEYEIEVRDVPFDVKDSRGYDSSDPAVYVRPVK